MSSLGTIQIFDLKAKALAKNQEKFTDYEFKPDKESLFVDTQYSTVADKGHHVSWEAFKFERVSDLIKENTQLKFLNGKVYPTQLIPGAMGNNYFLSAVSALSENQTFIPRLFLQNEINNAGYYGVWICDNGEWRLVSIDDNILTTKDEEGRIIRAFTRSKTNDIWISLLEKAYAKVHGSFENIKEGFTEYAIRDLTGVSYKTLYAEKDSHKIWSFIKRGLEQNYIVVGTYKAEKDIPGAYAYALLDAKEVYSSQGKERILLVRNPWGTFKWEGDWSKNSKTWTLALKKLINYDDLDDTKFWIGLSDFVNFFEDLSIIEAREGNYYKSIRLDHIQSNQNYSIIRLNVKKDTNIDISLIQKDERDFNGTSNSTYSYSYGRVMVGKVSSEGLIYQYGVADQAREIQCGGLFEEGVYIIVLEIHWVQNFHKKFVVSFYSTTDEISIEGVNDVDLLTIQKNLVKSAIQLAPSKDQNFDDYSSVDEPNIWRVSGVLHGILYFHYSNQSQSGTKISETVGIVGKNLKICPPFTKNNSFFVSIGPGGEIIVLIKIMSISHNYQLSFDYTAHQHSQDIDETESVSGISDGYKYYDNLNNRYEIDVNNDYNTYIRGRTTPYVETVIDQSQVFGNRSPKKKNNNEESKEGERSKKANSKSNDNQGQSLKSQKKPPKYYPEIKMGFGQIFSKKIPFTNRSDKTKLFLIDSSDSQIVHLKTTEFKLNPQESEDIRLRFIAPFKEGTYKIPIQVRIQDTDEVEEEIVFTVLSSGAYDME